MTATEARIGTPHARRYMTQLCKHFGHKRPTRFDEGQGQIDFGMGEARMTTGPETLVITVSGTDEETARRVAQVMESHLKRFSFREPDLAVEWVAKA